MDKNSLLARLGERYLSAIIMGKEPIITEDMLEPDKRSRPKVVREMAGAGFIHNADMQPEQWGINPSLWARISEEEPTFTFRPESPDSQGLAWNDLSLPMRKFIIERETLFIYRLRENYRGNVVRVGSIRGGAVWNKYLAFQHTEKGDFTLWVASPGFVKAQEEHQFEERVKDAMSHNMQWMLVELGLVEPVDADAFRQKDPPHPFFGENAFFGPDPSKWGQEMEEGIRSLRLKEALLRRQCNTLITVNGRVLTEFGDGNQDPWTALAAKYQEMIRSRLKKGEN